MWASMWSCCPAVAVLVVVGVGVGRGEEACPSASSAGGMVLLSGARSRGSLRPLSGVPSLRSCSTDTLASVRADLIIGSSWEALSRVSPLCVLSRFCFWTAGTGVRAPDIRAGHAVQQQGSHIPWIIFWSFCWVSAERGTTSLLSQRQFRLPSYLAVL